MKHVTKYYKLYPWSHNKDLRASIYYALNSAKWDTGNRYKRLIKEWYKNREDETINDIQFYKEIKAEGSRQMMDNDAKLKDRIEITDNEKRFIWSISKDRKIKVMEIQEYRIESSDRKNSKFIVIADGYKFKLGVPIYSAKTKKECIDYIDKVTAEKDHNF